MSKLKKEFNIIISWLSKMISLWFSSFQRRYNQHILYEHRVFNVRGLRTRGTFTLEIEEVFVELRVAPTTQLNFDPLSNQELIGNRPIWDFWRSPQHKRMVLAIIGSPGCGKTTLLQHLALIFASNKQRQYHLTSYVPILLFLRNHVHQIVGNEDSIKQQPKLADLMYEHFSQSEQYPNLKPPVGWFERHLNQGKCLILLDGLDEVADLEERQAVSAWIGKQILEYTECHFIITARPQGYQSAPIEDVKILEVLPFNGGQVKRFIEGWYLANEVTAFGGKKDKGVLLNAKQGAKDLMQRLRESPTLSALTVNPLLLTMIAMVHRYRGQLPGRRVELYSEICEVLLGHWSAGKGIQNALTASQKRVVLQPLAFQMMRSKIRTISTQQALKVITLPLERVGVIGESVQTFLNDVQASSGLLLERESNQWSFAHLTFQEYLAATHILDAQLKINWKKSVNNSWWYETFLLYGALGDATPVVQACLDNDTIAALTLAASSLEEARTLDMSVRVAVQERLTADLESTEPQCRRLAAEVRLNQRLRLLQRIDEELDIDLNYITCAEYQLFLDESRSQIQYYQPDHWTGYTFPKGTAQMPICGIRAKDAEAFCIWLSLRQAGEISYRLPNMAEAQEYPAQLDTKYIATWCSDEQNNYNLIFLTDSDKQRITSLIRKCSPLPMSEKYICHNISNMSQRLEHADQAIERALGHALALVDTDIFDRALVYAVSRDFAREIAPHIIHNRLNDIIHAIKKFETLGSLRTERYSYAFANATLNINRVLANACTVINTIILPNNILTQKALKQTQEAIKRLKEESSQPDAIFLQARNALEDACYALNRNFLQNRALAHARVLTRFDINSPICAAIEKGDLQHAQTFAQEKQTDAHPTVQRLCLLLNELLACATATTLPEVRTSWRKYVVQIADIIWIGYQTLEKKERLQLHAKVDYSEEKELILNLQWWLKILIARDDGNLSAWEGIRIVRKRNA
ncbi:MAG: NACHT domain-containing protein [Thiomargarita sp.]|nr:NACHT domain-containing protein [Thiomargarita sp.]